MLVIDTTAPDAAPQDVPITYSGFHVTISGERATLTLDRPERLNCQSPTMWDDLVRARRQLPGTVRVVVIQAQGRAFSAGLDRAVFTSTGADNIAALGTLPHDEATGHIADWQEAFDWSSRADLVTVAAVQGHAIGGGFQLALGADIRIAADDVLFCMAEPTLGIVPDLGGTKRLVDLVGVSRATEICLTGRRVDAAEALRIGLVSHIVPVDELGAAADRVAAAVLGIDRNAAAETKALLQRAPVRTQLEQQAAEREAQYRRLRTISGLDAED